MNFKSNILYTLLFISFVANASENKNESVNSSEEFTGKSPVAYEYSEFIRPGSPAAKALERDSVQKNNASAAAVVHGYISSEKK